MIKHHFQLRIVNAHQIVRITRFQAQNRVKLLYKFYVHDIASLGFLLVA